MKIKLIYYTLFIVHFSLLILFLAGCGGNTTSTKVLDTPTSGSVTIAVDESFNPFMDSEVYTFNGLYNEAHITAHYLPEIEAFKELINDSARIVVAARQLTKDEEAYFKAIPITPMTTKIAYDALAIIVNKENPDTLFTYNDLAAIMNGSKASWKDINSKSKLSNIQIVFDNAKSSTGRYIREKFNNNGSLPKNSYAVSSNEALVAYVSSNKNAIGILGVNWISDRDDTMSQRFLGKVNVAAIAPPDTAKGSGKYYQPYQAYIATGVYPLTRQLYIISREARDGLGNGFAAFVAGDKGQRIILKSALVPASVPVRIVGFRK